MEEDGQRNMDRRNDKGMAFGATAESAPVGQGMSSPSTQRVYSNRNDDDSVRDFIEGLSVANSVCKLPG